jgi:uncharacterized membrane protein
MAIMVQGRLPHILLSKGRVEALTDGIFAIVMTLLVLELKVPDLPHTAGQGEIVAKLRELRPFFFSFAITFVLSGSFWFFHHVLFHFVRQVTRPLVWLNIAFLMFVSLLPFSTNFMGHFIRQPIPVMFYFGNQFVLALLLKAQWIYAERQGLINPEANAVWRKHFAARTNALIFGYGAGLVVGRFDPEFSFQVMGIIMAGVLILMRIRQRREMRLEQEALTATDAKGAKEKQN